jgi:CDP-6-deoxy-D-xylo-4-hexulose-3-dehydrase
MQAAIGVEQLKKLPGFIERRKENFNLLHRALKKYDDNLVLPRPTRYSDPSWFGFPILVRDDAGFTRNDIVHFLEENKVATRMLFGGNLMKQPAYSDMISRTAGPLINTDLVMNNLFWIGVYPGINPEMCNYLVATFDAFFDDIK